MSNWEQDDTFLSRWLNGELSPSERSEFEDSKEGQEFQALIKAADALRVPAYPIESELAKLKSRLQEQPEKTATVRRLSSMRIWAIAAALALLLVVTYLIVPQDTRLRTAFGEQKELTLPDGSQVLLHANSQLRYDPDTWAEERTLRLEGEAYFEVTPGASFRVMTESGQVQVLGTSFNVRSRDEVLDVTCYTGKVEVTGQEATQLTPGMLVRLEAGVRTRLEQKELPSQPAWLQGITELNDVPLQEALAELRHVFGMRINYDATSNYPRYNGAFPHSDAAAAVRLVLEPLGIVYTYEPEDNILTIKEVTP